MPYFGGVVKGVKLCVLEDSEAGVWMDGGQGVLSERDFGHYSLRGYLLGFRLVWSCVNGSVYMAIVRGYCTNTV